MKFVFIQLLSTNDVEIAYGDGFGDLGLDPFLNQIRQRVKKTPQFYLFINSNDQIVPVSGFSSSDLEILGASSPHLLSFNSTHYEVIVRPIKNLRELNETCCWDCCG